MTESDLYEFCQGKEVDWRGEKLYIWLSFYELEEFTELLGSDHFVEGGMDVTLMYENVVIDLVGICKAFGINPEHIQNKAA